MGVVDKTKPALVVDDSRAVTSIFGKLLRQIGFDQIDIAHDGTAALTILRSKQYGFVLADWEMAPMNGPDLVKAIRQEPSLASLPIILATAHHQIVADMLHSRQHMGADGYMLKPFTADALAMKVAAIAAPQRDQLFA
jgi:two-component system chemotaxis response regulator CheY